MSGGFSVIDTADRTVLWSHVSEDDSVRSYVESSAVDRESNRAVLGFPDGRIDVWDLESSRRIARHRPHTDRVWAVSIAPNGVLACSASWDRALHVWELATGYVIGSFSSDDPWCSCVFTSDSRTVIAADECLIRSTGTKPCRTAYFSPWQNPVSERWVGSCRREMLDHVVVLGQRHLVRLLKSYVRYYHEVRFKGVHQECALVAFPAPIGL
jgi:WD40 repeat protein